MIQRDHGGNLKHSSQGDEIAVTSLQENGLFFLGDCNKSLQYLRMLISQISSQFLLVNFKNYSVKKL